MPGAAFIAGDWGTTHLRLFLCDAAGTALESVEGPGVGSMSASAGVGARPEFALRFHSLVQGWTSRFGALPAVLCGMIGSDMGWAPAPYVECPVKPADLLDGCVAVDAAGVHIVPGLRCRNRLDAPDVLRGEETQILGALRLDPALARGRHLLCMPGTHTKWVLLEDGCVREFLTAPTGELFSLLREHSVLVRNEAPIEEFVGDPSFEHGMRRFRQHSGTPLLHLMFECRSRRLVEGQGMGNAAAFLSGLLIAADVHGALAMYGSSGPVTLIGTSTLRKLYSSALAFQSAVARGVDGGAAALAGLAEVHSYLAERRARQAV